MKRTLLFFLFFLSGFSGLVYEVVWSRMLVLVFGNTTLATSIILSAFMAGLSLGSYFWGKWAGFWKRDFLTLFGCLEICAGLYALVFPLLLRGSTPLEVWLSGSLVPGHPTLAFLRALLCFFLIVIPTFFMGGTFAVLGRHLIRDQKFLGRDAALLYGLNTAGAVLGAGLTGFFLIRYLGNSGSYMLAAAVNFLVGLAALLMGGRPVLPGGEEGRRSSAVGFSTMMGPRIGAGLAMGGVFISGFCGLCYEVLWTRLLLLVVDNSVYSFTAILVAFLLGIALGSLLLAPLMKNLSNPLLVFGSVQLGIGFIAYLFPFTLEVNPVQGTVQYYSFLVQGVLFMVFLAAALMGMSLPLAAEIYRSRETKVGSNLGLLYALNGLGGVLGAFCGGFILIPHLGLLNSALLLNAMNWVTGGVILFFVWKGAERVGASAGVILFLLVGIWVVPDDLIRRKYGPLAPEGRMVFYKEGRTATAAIFDQPNGERILFLNGIPEVRNDRTSLKTFRMMGSLPCLLHPDPARGLAITFGGGITSGTMARFVEKLDCVEIVEEAREIAGFYAAENGDVLANPKVTLHTNDARHYLLTTGKRYGVIVADATHPRGYDSWVLFTREFYELLKTRLEPDGVFSQWVPLHGMSRDQYLAVVRTFFTAFPNSSLWVIDRTYTLLVARAAPGKIDFARFVQGFSRQREVDDLRQVGLENPLQVLSHFTMGGEGIRRMVEGFPGLITDDSPRHLFFPPGATFGDQFGRWPEENYLHVAKYEEPIQPYLTNLGHTESQIRSNAAAIRMYKRKTN